MLRERRISSVELVGAHLDRIRRMDGEINSFVLLLEKEALEAAAESDRRLKTGRDKVRALEGCPVALKDNFITKGVRTTCASRILENFIPPYEGTHSERLKRAGAVLLGKLNMDEFGMGSSCEHSIFGPVKNPINKNYSPGGSSGGSAAAVAARLCLGALGTDTGGSVRLPASFCGVVGLKPTYGRVSRYGMVAFASSLEQAGPLARGVADAASLLSVIAGPDPKDATCANLAAPDFAKGLTGERVPITVGLPAQYFGHALDPVVERILTSAIETLKRDGIELVQIDLPHTDYAAAAYYVICTAEASSNLARYDGLRYGRRTDAALDLEESYVKSRSEGFGEEVKRRIMLGTYCLSAGYYESYYLKAQGVRNLVRRDFESAFAKVDAILTPISPCPPFLLGDRLDDPLAMYLSDIYTVPANLAGLPAISLPCGRDKDNLPTGLQLIGKAFGEQELLELALRCERVFGLRNGSEDRDAL